MVNTSEVSLQSRKAEQYLELSRSQLKQTFYYSYHCFSVSETAMC